jgi:ring-1,2-phenylacetyl-CoA epoxidase subunit PaaC
VELSLLEKPWSEKVNAVMENAGLTIPKVERMITGGKEGKHSEHMGYILTELQYMQRTYPQMQW